METPGEWAVREKTTTWPLPGESQDEQGLDLDLTCHERFEVVFNFRDPAMRKLDRTKPGKRKRSTEDLRKYDASESSRPSKQPCKEKSARAGSSRTLDEHALARVLEEASAGFCPRAISQAIDVDERSRGIAMLVLMKNTFHLSPSAFMLSVSLYDRFLGTYQCDRLASASTTPKNASNMGQLPWDRMSFEVECDAERLCVTRPSTAGMKRVCAPLACLIMANKFIDVFAMPLSDLIMSAKQIFRMRSDADDNAAANSTSIGAFVLYERWLVQAMRTEDLREWEKIVWETLGYRLDDVTALDVLHALLRCIAAPMRRLIEDTAELKVQAAVCCPSLRECSPVDLAMASLLQTASELSVSDAQAVKAQICRAMPNRYRPLALRIPCTAVTAVKVSSVCDM
jgi:hypothetical protein